ncbi:MAG: hypothetical protein FWG83_01560 [Oscillospiraceae bacterium]|nr:hypothetical protein [Oscillospiraceae bacterium]
MAKTKFGISVGLFGAGLYFMGLINVVALVIMALYVLIYEGDEWLRKTAVKAVAVYVFFTVLSAFISLARDSESLLTSVAALFNGSIDMGWLNRILSICRSGLSLVQTLVLLMLGFAALKQGTVKIGAIDNMLE